MAYSKTIYVNDSAPALSADNLNNSENGILLLDRLKFVSPNYAEYGSISTSTGKPTDVDNRIRSGYIKPKNVPYTFTAKSGYTFNLFAYNIETMEMTTSATNQTSYSISNAKRIIRLVVKPDSGNIKPSDFPDCFTNSFEDCDIYGTENDLPIIRNKIEDLSVKPSYISVPVDYAEYGSLATANGKPNDTADRIRSGYIKLSSVPFTITASNGYSFNLFVYDENFEFDHFESSLTTKTISNDSNYYRIVVKPDIPGIMPSDFPNCFTNSFDGCSVYGTLYDINIIRKKTESAFENFSLNEHLTGLDDMMWEYQNWVYPQVVSHEGIRNNLYFTFTNEAGYSGVACYDYATKEVTKTYLKKNTLVDDHNLVAVLMMSNGKLLCAYSGGHNTDNNIFIRIARAKESIESFEDAVVLYSVFETTYSQLFEYNNKIYLFYRTGNKSWAYRISSDFGYTWTSEVRLVNALNQFYCQFTETTTDGVLRMCCYSNPDYDDTNIRMGFLHLDNMTLYDTDNTTIIGTTMIAPSSITIVVPVVSGKSNRLFNAAKTSIVDTKILYCTFTRNSGTDGEYYIYDNGTSVKVADAGYALWIPKYQLGIAWIGTNKVVCARGFEGKDLIEIYDYANGEVILNETVAENPRGELWIRTARPMVDINQKSFVYFKGYYDTASYTNFEADGVIYNMEETE